MRMLLGMAIALALTAAPLSANLAQAEDIIQVGDAAATYQYAAGIADGTIVEGTPLDAGCGCGDPCQNACGGHHGCGLFDGCGLLHGCLFGHHGDGCGHVKRRHANLWDNCGCNGSYKFPVPPLYTYHWPGLYSQQLMTDYHSPWRFPAIKPYTDEPVVAAPVQPAAFMLPVSQRIAPTMSTPGEPESIGDKMRRVYGQ